MLKLSTNKMLNLIISCTRFKRNYSGCTCRSSENLCSSSSGGKKKIESETQETINFLSFTHPLECWCTSMRICLWISSYVWPNSGYWCCLFITLWISLSGFVFGEFSPPGDKKKGLANPTKGFFRILKKEFAIFWEKKKLEIVRFRQCVFRRSPEPGRIPKKI